MTLSAKVSFSKAFQKVFGCFVGLMILLTLVACQSNRTSESINPTSTVDSATLEPIPSATPVAATCADLDRYWNQDWPLFLESVDALLLQNVACGSEPLLSKKYAAHFTYATVLEQQGDLTKAIDQYQAALLLDPERTEALDVLKRLQALPDPTPPPCDNVSDLPEVVSTAVTPDPSRFVVAQGDQLVRDGEVFKVRGVNYYPRTAPWHQFLPKVNLDNVATEFALIQAAGFNTIRIFLRYEPLFTCDPEDAVPNTAIFAKVDQLLALAEQHELLVIVTLNDLPDLAFRPLYTDWAHYDAQTRFIVQRYQNNPHILAWDLRNEGDLDYGVRGDEPLFERKVVIDWLAHISQIVREQDPHHLLTAGWWGDPTETAPYVDFLSFHHWFDPNQLPARIETYRAVTMKPLVLQEVGYHSWDGAPHNQRTEAAQADLLAQMAQVTHQTDISGWLVWTAFDFVPRPGQPTNFEHHFGLWRTDLTPKPVLDRLFP
ncbi:MAG: cellulase family glycosylhydrolase [Chloroflexota bacterium]